MQSDHHNLINGDDRLYLIEPPKSTSNGTYFCKWHRDLSPTGTCDRRYVTPGNANKHMREHHSVVEGSAELYVIPKKASKPKKTTSQKNMKPKIVQTKENQKGKKGKVGKQNTAPAQILGSEDTSETSEHSEHSEHSGAEPNLKEHIKHEPSPVSSYEEMRNEKIKDNKAEWIKIQQKGDLDEEASPKKQKTEAVEAGLCKAKPKTTDGRA